MKSLIQRLNVLLSIFKRKGGEGLFTKLITDVNQQDYLNQMDLLDADEIALLISKQDEQNWLLLTSNRVLTVKNGHLIDLPYSKLLTVSLAMDEEFQDGILSKEGFTRLVLIDGNGDNYFITVEKGKPYQGVYQVLHYIAINNKII
jgi:hypothetical protein